MTPRYSGNLGHIAHIHLHLCLCLLSFTPNPHSFNRIITNLTTQAEVTGKPQWRKAEMAKNAYYSKGAQLYHGGPELPAELLAKL